MHYYSFNIGDYRRDTSHLIPIEHYIHRTLMDWYYLDETPIPKITQVVMRRLNLGLEFEQNLLNVLNDFYVLHEDGWHQNRIDQEIEKYNGLVEKNQSNGKLGGRPKKTQVVMNGKPKQNPNESQNNPNQEPITNNHNIKPSCEKTKKKLSTGDRFDDFWNAWPKTQRKVGKAACLKKWKLKKLDEKADQIIAHIEALKLTEQWRDGFEPAPATYINQERWQDGVVSNSEAKTGNTPWFFSATGIESKGHELKIVMMKDEQFAQFRNRVFKAAGLTPEQYRKAKIDEGKK